MMTSIMLKSILNCNSFIIRSRLAVPCTRTGIH
jgi:hypothetical protein